MGTLFRHLSLYDSAHTHKIRPNFFKKIFEIRGRRRVRAPLQENLFQIDYLQFFQISTLLPVCYRFRFQMQNFRPVLRVWAVPNQIGYLKGWALYGENCKNSLFGFPRINQIPISAALSIAIFFCL